MSRHDYILDKSSRVEYTVGMGDAMTNTEDIESLKLMFTSVVGQLKQIDSELIAYQMALVAMRESQPEAAEAFERFILLAKLMPSYEKTLRDKYDLVLEQILHKISYVQTVTEACEEWLRAQKERKAAN
jgi:hypothetical protein